MTNYETGFFAVLGGFVLGVLILALVCLVIMVVSNWKIFEKAGQPGWAAIVPYYNTYVLYEMLNMQQWFVVYLVSVLAGIFVSGILATMAGLVTFGLFVYGNINLAKAFGKDQGFVVGLTLLPIVFYPILAFGDAEYQPENL